jgi:hypothetical protein
VKSEKPTSSTTDGGAQRGGWTWIETSPSRVRVNSLPFHGQGKFTEKNNSSWFYRFATNREKPNSNVPVNSSIPEFLNLFKSRNIIQHCDFALPNGNQKRQ